MTPADLRDTTAVRTWFEGLRAQSDVDPEADPDRLRILAAFCDRVGRTPDEIVADCLRPAGDGLKIRAKGRRAYAEAIAVFQAAVAGDAREQVRWGNTVRSFLIHNGVLLQAGLQLR
jgi:hypothetical protein